MVMPYLQHVVSATVVAEKKGKGKARELQLPRQPSEEPRGYGSV